MNKAVLGLFLMPLCALAAEVKVGDTPPDYLGKDADGNQVNVSAYKGKVVIATFWATWCGYCRKELPVLERVAEVAGKDRMQAVAVNYHEDRDVYYKLERGFKGAALTLTYDERARISESYGVTGLPNMFIIDKQGKVAYIHVGYDEENLPQIIDELNGLLAQQAAPAPLPAD